MNIARAKRLLRRYLASSTPCFAWGAPGIGKSDLMREIAAEDYDGNLVDFRAILRDPVDLRGLPTVAGDTAKWLAPDDLPRADRDGERGILFMDELNAAPPAMQAACFGLVLDRKVGSYVLPDGWVIAAAGNRQADRAAAQRMPTALANRFAHVDIEADVAEFVAWGNRRGVDPKVLAFVRFRPNLLHTMEGSDLRAFPSPRSWTQAAKYVNDGDDDRRELIAGCVGTGAAAEIEGFIRVYQNLPSLDLVLANPNKAPVPTEASARFAIAFGLSQKVDARSIAAGRTYLQRFVDRSDYRNRAALTIEQRDAFLVELAAIRMGEDGKLIDGGILPAAVFRARKLTS